MKPERDTMFIAAAVVHYIRTNPGQTAHDIYKHLITPTDGGTPGLDPSVESVAACLEAFQTAGIIRHDHNSEGECVFIHAEPEPLAKSGIRPVKVCLPSGEIRLFTKESPIGLSNIIESADDEDDPHLTCFFHNMQGEIAAVVRIADIESIIFGPEVASALQ